MSLCIRHKRGSSMVESCIVMCLLCMVLFGILQASQIVTSRNIINYASIATARAATVGLDAEMVNTVTHYATIPTAGRMVNPDSKNFHGILPAGKRVGELWDEALSTSNSPRFEQADYEVGVSEAFHRADYPRTVLDYENWAPGGEAEIHSDYDKNDYDEEILTITLSQKVPLTFPLARAMFPHLPLIDVMQDGEPVKYPGKQIDSTSRIENHARFYLKD
ncbi:MAG: hypothetical protein JXR25_08770 [Pontiellaceae bacterium]|nr:hypothetical protein [Pontiellaceae bacterium]MBN2784907.1 hypothetical protein [Pontiellaceae bacterium]